MHHLRRRSNDGQQPGANGATSLANVSVCVSHCLFDLCPCLLPRPSGVTLQAIHRLPAHCSLRAHMTGTEWSVAAGAALGLPEDVATRLFDAFYGIAAKQETRLDAARALHNQLSPGPDSGGGSGVPYATAANQRAVSLPGFMLFLMAQVFLERQRGALAGDQSQEQIMQSVKSHLQDIVAVACLGSPGKIAVSDVVELRIIFREFSSNAEAPFGTNIGSLWSSSGQQQQQGGGATPPTIDVATLVQFLNKSLTLPSEVRLGSASMVVHRALTHQTMFVHAGPPVKLHAAFKIIRASHCTFYCLAPLPSCVLSGLTNCVVVLGAVGGLVVVDRCEHCQIVCPCSSIVVTNCRSTQLFLCTNVPPAFSGEYNEAVTVAPYNTFYPSLEDHLATAGVSPKLNLFNQGVPKDKLMPVDQFHSIVVPHTAQGQTVTGSSPTTRTNPCDMPAVYAGALQQRIARAQESSTMLLNAYRQLEQNGQHKLADQLRSKVHKAFTEWLEQTGQVQGVSDLLNNSTTTGAQMASASAAATPTQQQQQSQAATVGGPAANRRR